MLSRSRTPRQWWQHVQDECRSYARRMRTGMIAGLIFAVLCAVCVGVAVTNMALIAAGVLPPPGPIETTAPTTTPGISLAPKVTELATATPIPLPTPTPTRLVSGPYLGGPDSIFHTIFTQTTDVAHLSGTVAGYQVNLYIRDGSGTDGQGRVREIEVTNWISADANAGPRIAKALLPPDAQYLTDVVGTGVDNWLRHVYRSSNIANSIPADDLAYDFGGTSPPPGNAEWYCYSYYSSAPDQCVITT
jgi:hypothetical protein